MTPHPQYRPGQRVWLCNHTIKLKLPCKKLSTRIIGTFKIDRQINPVTYHLQPSAWRWWWWCELVGNSQREPSPKYWALRGWKDSSTFVSFIRWLLTEGSIISLFVCHCVTILPDCSDFMFFNILPVLEYSFISYFGFVIIRLLILQIDPTYPMCNNSLQ